MASLTFRVPRDTEHENGLSRDHPKRPRRISLKYIILAIECVIFASMIYMLCTILYTHNFVDKKRARKESYADARANKEVSRLSRNLKYVLLWTPQEYSPFYNSNEGQKTFINRNCSSVNCFVTADRDFFNDDLTKFDAIAINGQNLDKIDLPKSRTVRQKYIFFNMESAENYPVCSDKFNGFFNWTATYRLDSDIPFPYIQIRNQRNEVVGPKPKMEWPDYMYTDKQLDYRQNKTKAVAWFVSNCNSRNYRESTASELKKELYAYGKTVDIYGACGPLICTRYSKTCDSILKKDYFFYLSFENSFSEDYVTEKLLTALQNDVVPIVLGGADYSRFLPPGSYLDARNTSLRSLAATINEVMSSPSQYNEFFKWKSSYTYRNPATTDSVCAMCAALSNETFFTTLSNYQDFRHWWHPGYVARCSAVLLQPDNFILLLFFFLNSSREN